MEGHAGEVAARQLRASSGHVGSAQLRALMHSPSLHCISEAPSPRLHVMASRALGGVPAREADPATDHEDSHGIAAAQASENVDAAPSTDDEYEIEDLTAGRQGGKKRHLIAQRIECRTWQRNERARCTSRSSTSKHFPV